MKKFVLFGLAVLSAVSMTACQVKVDDTTPKPPVNTDPVVNEKDYSRYSEKLSEAEKDLELRVGRRFVSVPGEGGRMTEKFDEEFYAAYRRQRNPNPTASQELEILREEMAELTNYENRALLFVAKFPDRIVIQKPDGSLSPDSEQHTGRKALAAKRAAVVGAKKAEMAPVIEKLEKEVNPPR